MHEIIKASKRYHNDIGWLETFWLFSFSDYYDPDNIQFGRLRVFNDDVVQANKGFSMHPHKEMEIITIILEGELTHEDNMGNHATIAAGEVQSITAGTGIFHSEENNSSQPVHLCQIWVLPDKAGLTPAYDQKSFKKNDRQDRLLLLASGRGGKDAAVIHADCDIFRCRLTAGNSVDHAPPAGRGVFVYLLDGSLETAGNILDKGDQLRMQSDGKTLTLTSQPGAEFILIDVAM